MSRASRALVDVVRELRGDDTDPDPMTLIEDGIVLIDGVPATSPRARVRAGAHVSLRTSASLRGSVKLRAALAAFPVEVAGRVALDVGAAAGGFTRVLLDAGARLVYAVDAGHGQLLGSLRQDPRVINLEAVNVGQLDSTRVPDSVDVVTIDVSYLALRAAVAQLDRVTLSPGCDLVGLLKPMFELRLPTAPTDRHSLDAALAAASAGLEESGWAVREVMDSPVRGSRGAAEMLVWARRR